MENIKSKESKVQKILDFKEDVTLLLVPLQLSFAWQILLMSGWKVIKVDDQKSWVTLSRGFCNV